jgi:LacI family transcriptional regulator
MIPTRIQSTRPGKASITEVAKQAGVSVATVSHVVNGKSGRVSATTAERVRQVITELGYRPSRAASALKSRRSRLLAVMVATASNPTMSAIAASIEAAARRRNLVMILVDTHEDPALQDDHLLEMQAQLVHGIALLAPVESEALAKIAAGDAPLVFVNRRPPTSLAAPYVGIDNRGAGAEVAGLLRDRKLLPSAVIHASMASSATAERVQGFEEAMAPGHVLARLGPAFSPDHLEIGRCAMGQLLDLPTPPKSVFCTSDLIAYGAKRCCYERGVDVPRDIALIGFDDNPMNDWIAPWLTSVRVPYDEFGEAILQALEVEDGRQTLLPHDIINRWLSDARR